VIDRVCGFPRRAVGSSLLVALVFPSLPFPFPISLSFSSPSLPLLLPLPFILLSRHPGASLARPLLSTRTIAMSAYPRMDPYRGSRYEHGIDAKVVVMGNSGELLLHILPSIQCLLSSVTSNKAWARPASYKDTLKTNTTPRTPHLLPVLFL
jgi:hypothetical protein